MYAQGPSIVTEVYPVRQSTIQAVPVPDKEKALLAVPEACADKIITLYHATLFAGHQGMIKTFLTITSKF